MQYNRVCAPQADGTLVIGRCPPCGPRDRRRRTPEFRQRGLKNNLSISSINKLNATEKESF